MAAKSQAKGLALPTSPEITDGRPNTPLPMMQLMVRAARLHRPMARTRLGWRGSGTAGLYHRMRTVTESVSGRPRVYFMRKKHLGRVWKLLLRDRFNIFSITSRKTLTALLKSIIIRAILNALRLLPLRLR
jgi:hypothetical protein